MSFGPRLELQRLVTEEIELTQQEQTLRQEIETLRAQIASARASQVVDAGRSGKQQRRQLDDLEAEYVQKLEALQRVRSAIRQIALGAHRLTFALPGVEKVARQAIIASPDYAAIETAAQELEEQRQATADAIATVFKSQSRNLVEQALAEVRAAERRNAADPSSPMQAVEPPSEETAAGAHEPASFLGPLFRDRGETDTEFELNLQRRVVELKAWASRNQRRAEVSVGAAIVAVALLGVVIITAESRGLLLAAASYVIPGAAALLIMAAQARERRRAATEEITDVENEALRG